MTVEQLNREIGIYLWRQHELMKHLAELQKAQSMAANSIAMLLGDNEEDRKTIADMTLDKWRFLYQPVLG